MTELFRTGSGGLPGRYHPWRDLRDNWPEIEVRIEPMPSGLLGELRYPVIALRAGTSAAQRRCTLTHELVHLERGVRDCGRWAEREEREVHAEVARRLIAIDLLVAAVRETGGSSDPALLAGPLDVDRETVRIRLELVTAAERTRIRAGSVRELWSVA
jgi:hypothetical protein